MTLSRAFSVCLAPLMALAPGCLAHHGHALAALSAGPTGCAADAIEVDDARTALGATAWRARCQGRAWRCVAAHNYDGPTEVACQPQ